MNYKERITNFSLDDDGINRWNFSHYAYMPGGACAACGHNPISHNYFVRHPEKGLRSIGSECISKVLGESMQSAIKAAVQRETRQFNNVLKTTWVLMQYEDYFLAHPEVKDIAACRAKDAVVVTGWSILSDIRTIHYKNYKDFYVYDWIRYFKYNEQGIEIPIYEPRNLAKHPLDENEQHLRSLRINKAIMAIKGQ